MYRLIGPGVYQTWGGIPELVATWKPPVALVMDHGPHWKWVKEVSPRTQFVGRFFQEREPDFNQDIDPIATAEAWLAKALRVILSNPWMDYWQGVNEPVIDSREAMARYAKFEAHRTRVLYHNYGVRSAIGSFAVGNPKDISFYREFLPAIDMAKRCGGVLSLHQYAWPNLDGKHPKSDPYWTVLRHRKVYDGEPSHGWEGLPKDLHIGLIITEIGSDFGVVEPGIVRGYADVVSFKDYLWGLDWVSRELQKDLYVLGACIFCSGNASPLWVGYDTWPDLIKALAQEAWPLYRKVAPVSAGNLGIDVSEHQGKIRWIDVARSGIMFALIRASVGLKKDRYYDRNAANAARHGVLFGSYHFQTISALGSMQATFFKTVLKPGALPEYHDLETYMDRQLGKKVGPTQAQAMEFSDRFAQIHRRPGPYSSKHMQSVLGMGNGAWVRPGASKWVADWARKFRGRPRLPGAWKDWDFQQITSQGTVAGINGRVDLDIFNGTPEEFRRRFG